MPARLGPSQVIEISGLELASVAGSSFRLGETSAVEASGTRMQVAPLPNSSSCSTTGVAPASMTKTGNFGATLTNSLEESGMTNDVVGETTSEMELGTHTVTGTGARKSNSRLDRRPGTSAQGDSNAPTSSPVANPELGSNPDLHLTGQPEIAANLASETHSSSAAPSSSRVVAAPKDIASERSTSNAFATTPSAGSVLLSNLHDAVSGPGLVSSQGSGASVVTGGPFASDGSETEPGGNGLHSASSGVAHEEWAPLQASVNKRDIKSSAPNSTIINAKFKTSSHLTSPADATPALVEGGGETVASADESSAVDEVIADGQAQGITISQIEVFAAAPPPAGGIDAEIPADLDSRSDANSSLRTRTLENDPNQIVSVSPRKQIEGEIVRRNSSLPPADVSSTVPPLRAQEVSGHQHEFLSGVETQKNKSANTGANLLAQSEELAPPMQDKSGHLGFASGALETPLPGPVVSPSLHTTSIAQTESVVAGQTNSRVQIPAAAPNAGSPVVDENTAHAQTLPGSPETQRGPISGAERTWVAGFEHETPFPKRDSQLPLAPVSSPATIPASANHVAVEIQDKAAQASELPKTHQVLDSTPAPTSAASSLGQIDSDPNGVVRMHIGIRTSAFGSVEIHTSVQQNQVGLEVHGERGLAHWFGPEVPALESGLKGHRLDLAVVDLNPARSSVQTATGFQQGQPRQERSYTTNSEAAMRDSVVEPEYPEGIVAELQVARAATRVSIRV